MAEFSLSGSCADFVFVVQFKTPDGVCEQAIDQRDMDKDC